MSRRLKLYASVAVLVALYATAGTAKDRVRVVNEGGIRDAWMLADGVKLAAPGYPASFAERGDNVCVAIGYSIEPDGSTSNFALLKSWSSSTGEKEPATGFWDAFTQAGANALSQWKFKPRPEVSSPQPTYTVATMHFMGKEATDPAALRGNCKIENLSAFLQEQKSRQFMNGKDKYELDRMNRQIEQAQIKAAAAAAGVR
ncbi:energy transducer TonB [Lysobacter sp. CFH 32150]|uniref:energy transducer TonB n=1 Tax=Lysobacter sp. CFH 32150 TaxID=2927128 RepID=UPI001FA7FDC5|nr:energy transducer TonB [Lysobacter sp. CFH 32150]MCI4568621.1 energy transducer TonB [Lysobacter sp. CFH 32150]